MTEIKTDVYRILSEELGTPVEQISDEKSLADDLGADSLDTVELVMAMEEHFGIEIDDENAEGINTVSDIVNTVTKLKG